MRNCHEMQELLSLYIDNCLEEKEKLELEEHLQKCPQCRVELEELQAVVGMFNSLDQEELIPPASFRRELRQKLEKENKKNKSGVVDKVVSYTNKRNFRSWVPLVAAALLLFIIVPVAMNGFNPLGTGSKAAKEEAKMAAPSSYGAMDNSASYKMRMNESVQQDAAFAPQVEMDAKGAAPSIKFSQESRETSALVEPADIERKIIKTGHLNLEVDSYKQTTGYINSMVTEMRGYIVNENTHIYDYERKLLAGNISLRIPNERFEEALNRLEQIGAANNRTIDSQDVTEEYVDVESRLKAMRLKEERLLAILDKSGTLGDVLAVENELARTRGDLEALEGRLRYLNNRTELSTINVTIRETLTPVKQIKTTGLQGILIRTQEAFIRSINSIIIAFGNLIVNTGAYIPFILLGALTLVILWLVLRKFLNKYGKTK
ncbi:MAG: DUF4349 domain-containing protein [Bacillota bacterium]